ncbi:MAG TPA: DUF2244 domain-containing protein [Hyphomicrobiaceae bacterium]|nr:DUF2244 domain-containing protein [Hyphomicrobiaceae bacterium]
MTDEATASRRADAILCTFDLWPHRSLGTSGMAWLFLALSTGLGIGVLRAPTRVMWPMIAGSLLTLVIMAVALWRNQRSARYGERIEIGPGILRLTRFVHGGRHDGPEFSTHWVRIEIAQHRHVERRIELVEGGRRAAIGDFLSPEERDALAAALTDAIRTARSAAPRVAGSMPADHRQPQCT